MRSITELILYKNMDRPIVGCNADYNWGAHGAAQTAGTVHCFFEHLHNHSRAVHAEAIITMATPGARGGVCVQAGNDFNDPNRQIIAVAQDAGATTPHTCRVNILSWFNTFIQQGTGGVFLWAVSYGDGTLGPLIYQISVELVLEPAV